MASLFKTMTLDRSRVDDAEQLLQLPRSLGQDPVDGKEIVASNGRYGPYVVKDKDFRTIDSEEQLLTITLDQASQIFKLPKVFKRGAARNMASSGPLREFGTDPVSERPVVAKDGRFGVYVTDGETNASIGKGDRIETMDPERAFELLAIRREQVDRQGRGPGQEVGGPQVTGQEVGGQEVGRPQEGVSGGDGRPLLHRTGGSRGLWQEHARQAPGGRDRRRRHRETGGTAIGQRLRAILHDTTVDRPRRSRRDADRRRRSGPAHGRGRAAGADGRAHVVSDR